MKLGRALVQTIRHFFPNFNDWLKQFPDNRFKPFIIYDKVFLLWWGIGLYLFQLGSRRQLDFELDARGTKVLHNLNRLAQTDQETRPVHKTLHHYLGRCGGDAAAAAVAGLRTHMLRRLMRMKALDAGRLQGRLLIAADATGHVAFNQPHCSRCLIQRHEHHTVYLHQVLEIKLLGPGGMALPMASDIM